MQGLWIHVGKYYINSNLLAAVTQEEGKKVALHLAIPAKEGHEVIRITHEEWSTAVFGLAHPAKPGTESVIE
jgi:hypothetical protein